LVFFEGDGDLGGGYCFTGGGGSPTSVVGLRKNCAEEMIALRRLADRFPALDITMVAPAHGYFKYLKPTSPAQEAELTRQFVASYGLKVPVGAMNLAPSWLPSPDGRRVDQLRSADVNWENYLLHLPSQSPPPGIPERLRKVWERANRELPRLYGSTIVLVDQGGTIIDIASLTREDAGAMARYIEVLVNRRP